MTDTRRAVKIVLDALVRAVPFDRYLAMTDAVAKGRADGTWLDWTEDLIREAGRLDDTAALVAIRGAVLEVDRLSQENT